jgi:hypothetical protein
MGLRNFIQLVFNYRSEKKFYKAGKRLLNDPLYCQAQEATAIEMAKTPERSDIINFLLSSRPGDTQYLEIGVRDPADNFNKVVADVKYSVDPGLEYRENPVDFKVTSDEFFSLLSSNEILSSDIRFDLIFIDGLHLAEQVNRDITNALKYIKDDGFIVLHDCNPPTEWHARETFSYSQTPAGFHWNGTTWKAFLKWRSEPSVNSCCIDSDWGVGVLSKCKPIGESLDGVNPFFEFSDLADNRATYLNLLTFDEFKRLLSDSM